MDTSANRYFNRVSDYITLAQIQTFAAIITLIAINESKVVFYNNSSLRAAFDTGFTPDTACLACITGNLTAVFGITENYLAGTVGAYYINNITRAGFRANTATDTALLVHNR